jgi:MoaA/NifB/PqqE/SkfB family radical SAM enzyme
MQNIIFHLVLTNQCNKRCEYCDLNFSDAILSKNNIIKFIDYINNNAYKYWEIRINFFWGEPLLEFQNIEYILKNITEKNVLYSIGTNGLLLDESKYKTLCEYDVEINYSIDTQTYNSLLKQDYIDTNKKNFYINFILNPNTIDLSFWILKKIIDRGVKYINLLPVYATLNWNKESLIKLQQIVNISKVEWNIIVKGLSYYDKPTSDVEYVIETNGNIYQDIHTHLWFLKQYENISVDIKKDIENQTLIWTLENCESNLNEIQFCVLINLYKMSLEIPKKLNFQQNFTLIDKILQTLKK